MTFLIILNLAVFAGLLYVTALQRNRSLSTQILIGLVLGAVFGIVLQVVYAGSPGVIAGTLEWTNVVGTSYINLLKMVIMPLVLIMMIGAVVRMREMGALGKYGGTIIGLLVGTTMIAAFVGVMMASMFGLSMEGMTEGARELERAAALEGRLDSIADLGITDMLVRFIPTNVFYDLTQARPTSIIAVVIFGILFGIAALLVGREDPEKGERIFHGVDTLQAIVMKLVRLIMLLTPYGILALLTKVVAGSSVQDIVNLLSFIVASYVAIAIMFGVHAGLLRLAGVDVSDYFRKVWPVLTFAFSSRSSAATIPLNVETQVDELRVPRPIANLSATFGATIGQNGCAGIYPAMLATMIAPTLGINPLDPGFLFPLIGIVAISSFGIAGVGGGATFAALVVLPAMGLPVALVALLISIEPLIDMARTALNVNGAMTAGVVTGRILGVKQIDEAEDAVAGGSSARA
jgi:L-cystine uptake protein TcyP (sodium:dicarboxylate symporter family)